jgi:putative molybdopterin biosynthesis protein
MEAEVQNHLADLRTRRGMSAAQLATTVGVSRQTIYAIEAGSYLPNTALSLKLAHALNTTVEEIFHLGPDSEPPTTIEPVDLLPSNETLYPGHPLRLCGVDGKLMAVPSEAGMWGLPPVDAILAEEVSPSSRGLVRARVLSSSRQPANRVLIAGCDPGAALVARYLERKGVELIVSYQNSSRSLDLLKSARVHLAGTHLPDRKTGASNLPGVIRIFGKDKVAVVSYATWEEGIVVRHGNPKSITTIADLARMDVRITNREEGAGCRLLLDTQLEHLGVESGMVRGYDEIAFGHLPAARQVQAGVSDCCISTRAAARALGLDFMPLVTKRYDLVLHRSHLLLPPVQTFIDALGQSAFRKEIEAATGYDLHSAGDRVL